MKKAITKHMHVTTFLPVKSADGRFFLQGQGVIIVTTAPTAFQDINPGDRESDCGGIMEPVAVWVRKGGEWAVIHRCRRCGILSSNRVAADDNPMKLMSIAMKPLCEPPFPLERIEEMVGLMGGDGSMQK